MKRLFALCVVILVLAVGTASAQSAKATASFADVHLLVGSSVPPGTSDSDSLGWVTILGNTIKTPNQKDLFIAVSIECGIYSDTLVRSSGGITDASLASGGVRIRVVVDPATPNSGSAPGASGFFASPSGGHDVALVDTSNPPDGIPDDASFFNVADGMGVSFCKRIQYLSAKLQGIIDLGDPDCFDADASTVCTLTDEEIRLIIATLDANAFNFIGENLRPGNHLVEVQAKLDTSAVLSGSQKGEAKAKAFVGMGSMTVEEVRMIRGEDISF